MSESPTNPETTPESAEQTPMMMTSSALTFDSAVQGEDGWLTLQEAARIVGVHTNTVRRWADRASIRSYRTIGGHRRLAARDIYGMAPRAVAPRPPRTEADTTPLDAPTVAVIESALRGEVSEGECRLRLRTLGHDEGESARRAGRSASETISAHLPIRRAISEVVANVRFAAGIGRTEVDEREWSDSLADAFMLGLAESASTIPARARGNDRRAGVTAVSGRRGPPQ